METNHEALDWLGMCGKGSGAPGPALMGADTAMGNDVHNKDGEQLGNVKELMTDMASAKIACAGLSFGGLLGVGDKLFAAPWSALVLGTIHKRFTPNVLKEALKDAPAFDKDHWPSMADANWASGVYQFYGTPYSRS